MPQSVSKGGLLNKKMEIKMENNEAKTLEEGIKTEHLAELTSEVVSAFVSNNIVGASEIPKVISDVYNCFLNLTDNLGSSKKHEARQKPAVPVKKSIADDYIICLEDGKKFKSLKRHLSSHYGLSPEAYREKWGLPADYPMVSPSYARARSRLAKQIGLGRKSSARSDTPKAA